MTKEEKAIDYLKYMRKIICDDYLLICPKDTVAYRATLAEKEFYDTAIKALEQESVIDKIRAEIETKYGQCDICEYFEDYDYEENDISEYRPIGNIVDILQIIDNYKAETEET